MSPDLDNAAAYMKQAKEALLRSGERLKNAEVELKAAEKAHWAASETANEARSLLVTAATSGPSEPALPPLKVEQDWEKPWTAGPEERKENA